MLCRAASLIVDPLKPILAMPGHTTRLLLLCLLFLAAAANQPSVANEGTTQSNKAGPNEVKVTVQRNLKYGASGGRASQCDVFLPPNHGSSTSPSPQPTTHPIVLVVHGGAWISGDKWTMEGYARKLARAGYVAIAVNYRLAPTHQFPTQVDDLREALVWAAGRASDWNADPERIGLFGYSAGGHLVTLIGSLQDEAIEAKISASDWGAEDPRWAKLPQVTAVCAGGPPCDFRSLPPDNTTLAHFLGGSRRKCGEAYCAASPAQHVSAGDPPTQIIQGDIDLLVPLAGSRDFHKMQLEAGVDSRLEVLERQGHMLTFMNPKTGELMIDFFDEILDVE